MPRAGPTLAHQRVLSRSAGNELVGNEFKRVAACKAGPRQSCVLGRDGDHGAPVAASHCECARPAADAIFTLRGQRQHRACAHHQQTSQVGIPGFGDAAQARLAAGAVLTRDESELGSELPSVLEFVPVADARHKGARTGLADTRQGHQACDAPILPCDLTQLGVVGIDAFVELGDGDEQIFERFARQAWQRLDRRTRLTADHARFER